MSLSKTKPQKTTSLNDNVNESRDSNEKKKLKELEEEKAQSNQSDLKSDPPTP